MKKIIILSIVIISCLSHLSAQNTDTVTVYLILKVSPGIGYTVFGTGVTNYKTPENYTGYVMDSIKCVASDVVQQNEMELPLEFYKYETHKNKVTTHSTELKINYYKERRYVIVSDNPRVKDEYAIGATYFKSPRKLQVTSCGLKR